MTLFPCPEGVTVSGEDCKMIYETALKLDIARSVKIPLFMMWICGSESGSGIIAIQKAENPAPDSGPIIVQ